ncbi:uncharacterized protein LOC122037094 isoform X1 [Zingiber officinale]|uniref:COMM domain-containing protein n=1 Tax=Zingiber officinale TaxID=94328 RepID=A0A8J5C239_ZINOF|nr:uncharacterized protein LOC122037094 isoform X1 [Zingiber officinale]KAG6467297.1 hypothetical protein ZIOFF_074854 [Zingiber officinale]
MEGDPALVHLLKLPPATPQGTLSEVLQTLWKNRRTGLDSLEKSRVRSLLALSVTDELDPILASLRCLIRKCIGDKLAGDNISKLFPPGLPTELQTIILLIFNKYLHQWIEESLTGQPLQQQIRISDQVKVNATPALPSFSLLENLSSTWQINNRTCINNKNVQSSNEIDADSHSPLAATMSLHEEFGSSKNMAPNDNLPRLRSMTWTMQNRNSQPSNRVAIITLKLQDYANSPSGELDVKFQLSKDTLEATLRTMSYISEELLNSVDQSSEPSAKKHKQQ